MDSSNYLVSVHSLVQWFYPSRASESADLVLARSGRPLLAIRRLSEPDSNNHEQFQLTPGELTAARRLATQAAAICHAELKLP